MKSQTTLKLKDSTQSVQKKSSAGLRVKTGVRAG